MKAVDILKLTCEDQPAELNRLELDGLRGLALELAALLSVGKRECVLNSINIKNLSSLANVVSERLLEEGRKDVLAKFNLAALETLKESLAALEFSEKAKQSTLDAVYKGKTDDLLKEVFNKLSGERQREIWGMVSISEIDPIPHGLAFSALIRLSWEECKEKLGVESLDNFKGNLPQGVTRAVLNNLSKDELLELLVGLNIDELGSLPKSLKNNVLLSDFAETLESGLSLTFKSVLNKIHAYHLKILALALVKEAKSKQLNLGQLAPQMINRLPIEALTLGIERLAASFPKEESTKLAIDRKVSEFSIEEERLDGIIDDINKKKLPVYRYWELLYENLYSSTEIVKDVDGEMKKSRIVYSKTFLAYALPKLDDLDSFLIALKNQLGLAQFNLYLETHMLIAGKEEEVAIQGLYVDNYGHLNEAERHALSIEKGEALNKYIPKIADKDRQVIEVDRVNTHNESSNKSSDESHVTAFKMMLEANPDIKVEAIYSNSNKKGKYRNVIVKDRRKLEVFVVKQIKDLRIDIESIVNMKDASAAIYDKYCRRSDVDAVYSTLSEKDRELAGKKVYALVFQAETALRYIDNVLKDRWCNSGRYSYRTNESSSCGLTIEEMIASCYWASKDKKNFNKSAPDADGILALIVAQLHDMRRGYNIDSEQEEIPEKYKYPARHAIMTDHHRCAGGAINSLAWALKPVHKAYKPKLISQAAITRYLKEEYSEIAKANVHLFNESLDKDVLRTWSNTGKVTGNFRKQLQDIFNAKHKAKFENKYKGYIDDKIFKGVIDRGLDNMAMPKGLKKVHSIKNLSDEDIYSALLNESISLLHFDEEKGYESTINYLSKLPQKNGLLIPLILKKYKAYSTIQDTTYQTLSLYLSRSRLDDQFSNIEVTAIEGKSILLEDISGLSPTALKLLLGCESLNDIIETSIEWGLLDLFAFYAHKIGFKAGDFKKAEYGYKNQTILLSAITYHATDIAIEILKTEEGRESLMIEDINGDTALSSEASWRQVAIVKEILKTEEGRKCLLIEDEYGRILLHNAISFNNFNDFMAAEIVDEILKVEEGRKSLQIRTKKEGHTPLFLAAKRGFTFVIKRMLAITEGREALCAQDYDLLQYVVKQGYIDIVKEILKVEEGRKLLLICDSDGNTPLHNAINLSDTGGAYIEIIKEILKTEEGRKLLLICDSNGNTPLHNAINLPYTGGAYIEIIKEILKTEEGRKSLKIRTKKEGLTPLFLAVKRDLTWLINLMLETPEGREALFIKGDADQHVYKYVFYKLEKEETVLDYAIKRSWIGLVQGILKTEEGRKLLCIQSSKENYTPTHLAVMRRCIDIIKEILKTEEGKRSLSIGDSTGETPLFLAKHEDGTLREILLARLEIKKARAHFNHKNMNGDTALHKAAFNNDINKVKTILEMGWDVLCVNIENKYCQTPLDLAIANVRYLDSTQKHAENRKVIIDLLREKGGRTATEIIRTNAFFGGVVGLYAGLLASCCLYSGTYLPNDWASGIKLYSLLCIPGVVAGYFSDAENRNLLLAYDVGTWAEVNKANALFGGCMGLATGVIVVHGINTGVFLPKDWVSGIKLCSLACAIGTLGGYAVDPIKAHLGSSKFY